MVSKVSKASKRVELEMKLRELEIKERKKNLDQLEDKLKNESKYVVVRQVDCLRDLLSLVLPDRDSVEYKPLRVWDEEDELRIRAKIMRLINTF